MYDHRHPCADSPCDWCLGRVEDHKVTFWGLIAVLCIYLVVALGYARERRWGMCLVFVAYALANAGLLLDLRQH